ncbi:nucleotidyltransferase family protein [Plantactinospora mayteni]|uniref:nucleotidyltransferase family protein n=1 Tax=Plantactinospora mayteni TaxID=566021 RepID=UPI00194439FF
MVWGERYGSGFSPERVRDVDVAFFDPHDLNRANDDRITGRLHRRCPQVPWGGHATRRRSTPGIRASSAVVRSSR